MIKGKNAIEVTDVKKSFKVYYDRGTTVKDKILTHGRSRYEVREVLKGISFTICQGEAVGLIGKNGCGKSTTLKLLSKIIYPNEGTIRMEGRVSSLLELGAGFHPDMSGRENIYMNAAVFGLTRKEIKSRIADIIKFSELEEFIDNPVRTYSSGMYMRLAFSVAINVDADILLIDEILAVGDISFQKKCFEKLEEIKKRGTTIVIVSHSLDQIEKICDRTVWLENGLIHEIGAPMKIHRKYLADMEKSRLARFEKEYYEGLQNAGESEAEPQDAGLPEADQAGEGQHEEAAGESPGAWLSGQEPETPDRQDNGEEEPDEPVMTGTLAVRDAMREFKKNFLEKCDGENLRRGTGDAVFTRLFVTDGDGRETVVFETGSDARVYMQYENRRGILKGTFCLLFYREDGVYYYGTNTFIEKQELMEFAKEGWIQVQLRELPLLPGKYYICVCIHDERVRELDFVENAVTIQMYSNKGEQGIARINNKWEIE